MKSFLDTTYGVLVYQDDLLMTAIEVAGYSWGEVDKFRKAVGKKIPEEMRKQHISFVEGCQKHGGMSEEKAEALWNIAPIFVTAAVFQVPMYFPSRKTVIRSLI